MKKFVLLGLGGLVLLAILLGVFAAGSYNKFLRLEEAVNSAWAQVQNVYQRRADLIPNLVSTVSGAANFEKSTLEAVTQARASVGRVQINANEAPQAAAELQQFQQAQDSLSRALSRLLVVAENYPELKANRNFLDLQTQLEGTENRISVERGRFNEAVQRYNTGIRSFPGVLVAGIFGHRPRPYFTAQEGADQAPKVQFDFGGQKK